MMKPFETSKELIVCRYKNGIKLISPRKINKFYYNTGYTVDTFFQLSLCVGIVNTDNCIVMINEESAFVLGFSSPKSAENKSIYDVSDRHSAAIVVNNYHKVFRENQIKIHEEHIILKNDSELHRILIHSPLYSHDDKIIGLTGLTIIVGKHSIAEALFFAVKLGLLGENYPSHFLSKHTIDNILLSKRQIECLKLIARGKSAREIGDILGLSKRTIESYIENLKNKLKVANKSDLIEKAIDNDLI